MCSVVDTWWFAHIRTGGKAGDSDEGELLVRDPRVVLYLPVHGAARAALVEHPRRRRRWRLVAVGRERPVPGTVVVAHCWFLAGNRWIEIQAVQFISSSLH